MNVTRRCILQVNTSDAGGGAERVAWNLHEAYRSRGHESYLAVGRRRGNDPSVLAIRNDEHRGAFVNACRRAEQALFARRDLARGLIDGLRHTALALAHPRRTIDAQLGREHFDFPGSHAILSLPPRRPDVLHLHNLHGDYFDLRALASLSARAPTFVSLHDAWMLTGHCAHGLGCERWQTGCGSCPHLSTYPAVKRDATAYNWRRKRDIYAQSRLYVTAPSHWLIQQVEQSMLAPAILDARVVPNGVDQSIYHAGERAQARASLALPQDADILLFAANGIRRSDFKDFALLQAALEIVGEVARPRRVIMIALGEDAPSQRVGHAELRYVPHQREERILAAYYRASDIYVHAAKADTFPMTIIEALACGTPVVATAVGGIPEQVDDGETGFLTPAGDARAFAARISLLLDDPSRRRGLGRRAAEQAAGRFDLGRQVEATLDWYEQVLEARQGTQPTRRAA